MERSWEVSGVKCQCFGTRSSGEKESEEENLALPQQAGFQAGGISALVGGASRPPPAARWPSSVECGGQWVPGVSWEHWRVAVLAGRSVPYCFGNWENSLEPAL